MQNQNNTVEEYDEVRMSSEDIEAILPPADKSPLAALRRLSKQKEHEDLEDLEKDALSKRKRIHLCMLVSAGGLTLLCVVLVTVLGLHHSGAIRAGGGVRADACVTSECIAASAALLGNMNTSHAPCENFYQYSCGGFHATHGLHPGAWQVSQHTLMYRRQEERLRELVNSRIARREEMSSERKVKTFYQVCNNEYGRIRDAGKPLLDLVQQHLKGWYVTDVDIWNVTGFSIDAAVRAMHGELNVNALFGLYVGRDWVNSENTITIGVPWSGTWHKNDTIVAAYKKQMRQLANLLVRDADLSETVTQAEVDARVEQFVSDAYGQEFRLMQMREKAGWKSETGTIRELEKNYTHIPWRGIMRDAFEGLDVGGNHQVRVSSPDYMRSLEQMLRTDTDHKDRILNNYFVWQILQKYSHYLSQEYTQTHYQYWGDAYSWEWEPSTWEVCLWEVKWRMSVAMGALYVQTHLGDDEKKKVNGLVDDLQNTTAERVSKLPWMDEETAREAVIKIEGITRTVGLPELYYQNNYLDVLHGRLVIDGRKSYLENFIQVEKFQKFLLISELQSGKKDRMWQFTHLSWGFGVSPYFSWRGNHLLVPAGAMQAPLYLKGAPDFFNYGALGTLIAEDMTRSYNEWGQHVKADGTFGDWWSKTTWSNYNESKKCFHDYYANQTVGPYMVKGEKKTAKLNPQYAGWYAMHNVAGSRIGLDAYRKTRETPEAVPIGLDLTADQAYFVSFAQTQCTVTSDERSYYYARWGHLPPENKLNGELSHVPEFAEAFGCRQGSKMVAAKRCKVY